MHDLASDLCCMVKSHRLYFIYFNISILYLISLPLNQMVSGCETVIPNFSFFHGPGPPEYDDNFLGGLAYLTPNAVNAASYTVNT